MSAHTSAVSVEARRGRWIPGARVIGGWELPDDAAT